MTQRQAAFENLTTPEMEAVARAERISVDVLRENVRKGETVILKNRNRRNAVPLGVG